MLGAIETATGKTFSAADQQALIQRADELNLVNSGLEETMRAAFREMMATLTRHPEMKHLRTAAMVNAINKVARSYAALGIWP
jgi:glutamate dehydrogenase (NAD(P)+)